MKMEIDSNNNNNNHDNNKNNSDNNVISCNIHAFLLLVVLRYPYQSLSFYTYDDSHSAALKSKLQVVAEEEGGQTWKSIEP